MGSLHGLGAVLTGMKRREAEGDTTKWLTTYWSASGGC